MSFLLCVLGSLGESAMLFTGDILCNNWIIFHCGFVFNCMVDIEIKLFTSSFNQPDGLCEIILHPGGAMLETWISFIFVL